VAPQVETGSMGNVQSCWMTCIMGGSRVVSPWCPTTDGVNDTVQNKRNADSHASRRLRIPRAVLERDRLRFKHMTDHLIDGVWISSWTVQDPTRPFEMS